MRRLRRTLQGVAVLSGSLVIGLVPCPVRAALSIANPSPSSATVSINTGLLDGALPAADWSDTSPTGTAWHGTVAVGLLNLSRPWTKTSGSHTLTVTTSGTYTGTSAQAYHVVTVTSDTGANVSASVTGSETATITNQAKSSPIAVGTKGVTIKFDTAVTYSNGDQFTIHVGNMPASAMALHPATGSITTTSGSETASFKNGGTTVTGGTATTVGTAVAFVTTTGAPLGGAFRIVPGVEITYDKNNVWAGAYVAQVSYSIVTGP
jgi:hypothetical protein